MKPAAASLLAVRVLLASVFIASGFEKLNSPVQNFAAVIEKYQFIPAPLLSATAHAVPWIELVLGVLFALGLWTRASLLGLWVMNTGFIVLIGSALVRKLSIDECGCFGTAVSVPLPVTLALDCVLWVLFLVYFRTLGRVPVPSLDNRFSLPAGR